MKLVFPGGEHPHVVLGRGVSRIGSAPDANIVLDGPGVQPQHCTLHVTTAGVMLAVPPGTSVTVNDRRVDGLIALRPGDSIAFDRVLARLASVEAPALPLPAGASGLPEPANDDPGATAIRPVMPRYVLRGVSGAAFGRNFPLVGATTVGRAPECAIRLDEPGMSRMHARLLPSDDALLLEDLGSANGVFLNGRRVLRGEARPGDEVGFDTLRFRLLAPGQVETPAAADAPRVEAGRRGWAWPWVWLAAAIPVVAALSAALLLR